MNVRRHPLAATIASLAAVLILMLLAREGQWELGPAAGQTVPWSPPPTFTPVTSSAATPTWTLLPTWTSMPGTPGLASTVTPTGSPLRVSPTLAAPGTPTVTSVPVSSIVSTEQRGLVIVILTEPIAAGPSDAVNMVVRIANVSRSALQGVTLQGTLPEMLAPTTSGARISPDCPICTWSPSTRSLVAPIATLPSGEQLLFHLTLRVDPRIWPGRVLTVAWQGSAVGVTAQCIVGVEIPWAELPYSGTVAE